MKGNQRFKVSHTVNAEKKKERDLTFYRVSRGKCLSMSQWVSQPVSELVRVTFRGALLPIIIKIIMISLCQNVCFNLKNLLIKLIHET